MTFRTAAAPFYELVRPFFAFLLVLAGLSFFSPHLLANSADLGLAFDTSHSNPQFNLVLPQRGLALQAATGTISDDDKPEVPVSSPPGFAPGDPRMGQGTPGVEAALGAVFPSASLSDGQAGFVVYAIDPLTGQGHLVFEVGSDEVNAALAEAVATGVSVLIAPDDNAYPRLYALPSNECMLISLFPDNKEAHIVFDCA